MYKLYIDESGKNKLSGIAAYAPHFCVSAVLVHSDGSNGGVSDFLRRRGDEIKFKYWGHRNNVVFHAAEIRRNIGDFSIFANNQNLENEFRSDLRQYLSSAGFKFIWIGVNKSRWINANPPIAYDVLNGFSLVNHEKSLTQNIFEEIFEAYIYYLIRKDHHGQVIIEASDGIQDGDILAAYNKLMFNGLPRNGWSNRDIRNRLTCISFVTKKNKDPETQLADIGALTLNIDARVTDGTGYGGVTQFDKDLELIFKSKAFSYSNGTTRINSIRRLL